MKEPELWKSSRVLYSAILTDTVTDHRTNADDLDILSALKGTLGLGHEDVAACHHEVYTPLSLLKYYNFESVHCVGGGMGAWPESFMKRINIATN